MADVDGDVRRRNHLHLRDTAVNQVQREIELADHTQRNSATAGLAVVELPLEQESLNATLGKSFGSRSSSGAAADHRDSEVAAVDFRASFGSGDIKSAAKLGVGVGLGLSDEMGLLWRGLAEAGEGFEGDGGHFVEEGSGAGSGVMAVRVGEVIFIYLMDMV